jgi:ABC-type uncharacterized transport system substrate-binding protein
MMYRFITFFAVLTCLSGVMGRADAHPHVWVTMTEELLYAPDGSVTGVRHAWTFDDMFSAFATQGIDHKTKGTFTRDELAPLAKVNVESLKEYAYFTYAKVNGKRDKDAFDEPVDYWLDFDPKDAVLTLHFTLPFKAPVKVQDLDVEIYDPSYFVDFSFVQKDAAALVGAPATCKLTVRRPAEMDAAMALRLGQLPVDIQLDPSQYLSNQFANKLSVKCP